MESIIKELWYGNINPLETGVFNTREIKEALDYVIRHCDELEKGLTKEQQELFEKVMDSKSEYESLAETAVFLYAFRLGAKMIIDIVYGENPSK